MIMYILLGIRFPFIYQARLEGCGLYVVQIVYDTCMFTALVFVKIGFTYSTKMTFKCLIIMVFGSCFT